MGGGGGAEWICPLKLNQVLVNLQTAMIKPRHLQPLTYRHRIWTQIALSPGPTSGLLLFYYLRQLISSLCASVSSFVKCGPHE